MMNLLLIAEDTSRGINKNFHYLEEELKKLVNLLIWRKPGHISHIFKKMPARPDFILILHDMEQRISPMIKGLANTNIPTGLFVNDVHRLTNMRRNYIEKNKIDYLFPVVRDKFIDTYPEFKSRMEWLPHFIHPGLYKDYGLQKDIDLLMMGAVNDVYPLRQKILTYYSRDERFVFHRHPGYREFHREEEQQNYIGYTYAKEVNRAKIFFTCPSIFYYPVIKYFEVLACRTLLLAPTFRELEDLGFIPGYHFVPINEHNFKEKAAYYLQNETERQKISEQGYHFIHQNHTVNIRAHQLVKRIKSIIKK